MTTVFLVEINQQPIELYKLLKIADLVSGGGEAKIAISEGYVYLNNEVEFQKRKKVYDGDYIQFGDNIVEVAFVQQPINHDTSEDSIPPLPPKNNSLSKQTKNKKIKQKSASHKQEKGKRKPIHF